MALREELEQSGNWLFRWRSYVPLLLLALFLGAMYEYPEANASAGVKWEMFSLLVSFAGLGIRILTIGYTPKNTSGRNTRSQVADTLNTSGIYSLVRNPLYLGNYLMALGFALFTALWWVPVIYSLVFWLYYERIIFAEESFLRDKFGEPYLAWAAEVPPFLPRLRGYQPAPLAFSLRNVLRREYNGFSTIIFNFFLLELASNLFTEGRFNAETPWDWLAAAGFLIWVLLRTLKRHTKLLDVEGR